MDKLEKYIIENRQQLDNYEAPQFSLKTFTEWVGKEENVQAENTLTHFIKTNKASFEQHEPRLQLWEKIEKGLDEQKQEHKVEKDKEVKMVPLRLVWQVAASFLIIIVAMLSFFYLGNKEQQLATIETVHVEKMPSELMEVEQYYTSLIHHKMEELRYYEGNAEWDTTFVKDIQTLDTLYQSMKEELIITQNNERVVSAMMNNLMLRINILNQQLEILKQIQAIKNKKDETENNTKNL